MAIVFSSMTLIAPAEAAESILICDLTADTASQTDTETKLSQANVGDTVCVPAG